MFIVADLVTFIFSCFFYFQVEEIVLMSLIERLTHTVRLLKGERNSNRKFSRQQTRERIVGTDLLTILRY